MASERIEDVISRKEKEALEAIQALRERCDRGESRPGDSQTLRAITDEAEQEIEKCNGDTPAPKIKKKRGTEVVYDKG